MAEEHNSAEIHRDLVELPQRIKFARKFWGWTQSDLAERAGVEQPSISRYERGSRLARVSLDSILRLAEALQVDLVWLATGNGRPFGDSGPTIKLKQAQ